MAKALGVTSKVTTGTPKKFPGTLQMYSITAGSLAKKSGREIPLSRTSSPVSYYTYDAADELTRGVIVGCPYTTQRTQVYDTITSLQMCLETSRDDKRI